MRTYPVKENPIGSVDSEILWYKQTDRQTDRQTGIVLLCIVDYCWNRLDFDRLQGQIKVSKIFRQRMRKRDYKFTPLKGP